jgi:signal transduction histidine kinase
MISRSLKLLSYLLISVFFGIGATLVLDRFVNISVEKEIKAEIEREIRKSAVLFQRSAGNLDPDSLLYFVKEYVAGVMKEKIIAVDPTSAATPDKNDFAPLFSFGQQNHHLNIYIKKAYLQRELAVLNTPELVFGVFVTITCFFSIILYTDKKKEARAMQQHLAIKDEEFRQALAEHEALALLGRMAATLAHELKTPLATISNLIQALPGRIDDESFRQRFLAMTGEELRRSQQLIDNLLVYGKEIETLQEQWLDFPFFIGELAAANSLQVSRCPRFSIFADPFYLRLLLENLLRNSRMAGAKHMAIDLAIRHDGATGEISLEDDGKGFPAEADLTDLLNPFVTFRSSGAGLGLFLAHKIATAHQASLTPYRPGRGAGIRLTLQLSRIRQ